MKSRKLKVFAFGVIATSVMTLSVSAKDVSNITGLKDCLAAENETECKLTSGTWLNQSTVGFKVKGTKTLDLNSQHLNLSDDFIMVLTDASLTVKNGEIEKGESTTTGRVIEVRPGGKLDIASDATITGNEKDHYGALGIIGYNGSKKTAVDIAGTVNGGVVVIPKDSLTTVKGVTLNVNEGAVLKAKGHALTINGKAKTGSDITVNVLNATLESTEGQGIYAAGLGTWNITGATVSGTEGIGIKSGTVNINGGKFTGKGEYKAADQVVAVNGGSDDSGAAIAVSTDANYTGDITLNIKGDVEAISEKGAAVSIATPGDANALKGVTIEDGKFVGAVNGIEVAGDIDSAKKKHYITGGAFQKKNEDGSVTAGQNISDYIDSSKYTVDETTGEVLTNRTIEIKEATVSEDSTDTSKGTVNVTVGNNNTVHETDNSGKTTALVGNEVQVSVQISDENLTKEYDYEIKVMAGENEIKLTDGKFTMPDEDVTITVTYKLKRYEITGEDVLDEDLTGKKDEKVKVKIKDHDGYTIGEVTVTPATGSPFLATLADGKDGYEFTMPGCAVALTVKYNAIKYNITKAETTNGSFTISKTEGFVDEEVTVDAVPADGYIVDKITYTYQARKLDENGQPTEELETKTEEANVVKNTGKFTIPADMSEGKTIVVSVSFKEGNYDRTITVKDTTNGKVEAPTNAEVGDEVNVTVTPDEGYEVDKVVVATEDGTEVAYKDGKFTMPDGNVTITATFKEKAKEPIQDDPSGKPSDGEDRPEENPNVLKDNGVAFDGGEEFAKEGYEFQAVEVKKTEEEIEKIAMTGFNYLTTYDLSMLKDGEMVEMVDGTYKISIPVENLYDTYKVAYLKDGKVVEELDATYDNGNVVFTTTHLSEYAVYGRNEDTTNNTTVVNPQTGDSILKYVAIAMLSVGALGISLKKYVK